MSCVQQQSDKKVEYSQINRFKNIYSIHSFIHLLMVIQVLSQREQSN